MILINSSEDLRELCLQIRRNSSSHLGIDTEFIRRRTYYPILCLVQGIFTKPDGKDEIFLLDTLRKDIDMRPFSDILGDGNIRKVIHSFSQDLDALQFFFNGEINNIEDTQIMAGFCGYECSLGYISAIGSIVNIGMTKNKTLQASNWQRRPLTEKQLVYACNDVKYLLQLYDVLRKKVEECGNYEFYRSEVKYLQKHRGKEYVLANSWKRLKLRIHRKTMGQALLMKNLAVWRETRAMESNRIRSLILEDSALQTLARVKPKTLEDLKKLYRTNRKILNIGKTYKDEILELIRKFTAVTAVPAYNNELYYTGEMGFGRREELDSLYTRIATIASVRNIYPERVINKMDLIALMMGYEDKKNILYGWKSELLGELFEEQPAN
ncbi:MAG: HRDC domain-containing protein [Rickettsiales bacterium]|jgi:ribonuclease D|nr:HRDC domain-containing protein [Rickettsiales bacterium]